MVDGTDDRHTSRITIEGGLLCSMPVTGREVSEMDYTMVHKGARGSTRGTEDRTM